MDKESIHNKFNELRKIYNILADVMEDYYKIITDGQPSTDEMHKQWVKEIDTKTLSTLTLVKEKIVVIEKKINNE